MNPSESSSGVPAPLGSEPATPAPLEGLRADLQAIATRWPRVSFVRLTSQWFELALDYEAPGGYDSEGYERLSIQAHSWITFRDADGEVRFKTPLNDPSGTIPCRPFTIETAYVWVIDLDLAENCLIIVTDEGTFEFSFFDSPWESILIKKSGVRGPFAIL